MSGRDIGKAVPRCMDAVINGLPDRDFWCTIQGSDAAGSGWPKLAAGLAAAEKTG